MKLEAAHPRRSIWIWMGKKWQAGIIVSTFTLRGVKKVYLGLLPHGNAYASPEQLEPRRPMLNGLDKPRPPRTANDVQMILGLEAV